MSFNEKSSDTSVDDPESTSMENGEQMHISSCLKTNVVVKRRSPNARVRVISTHEVNADHHHGHRGV